MQVHQSRTLPKPQGSLLSDHRDCCTESTPEKILVNRKEEEDEKDGDTNWKRSFQSRRLKRHVSVVKV